MPINGIFRTIENSNGAELEKLQSALSYGSQNSAGQQLLNDTAGHSVDLVINHEGLNQTSMSPDGHFTISWDPDTAIQVVDANGNVSNYESPATNLFHEMSHAADPNFAANVQTPDSQYDNLGDKIAIERTNSIFVPLGEEGRTNHSGALVSVNNPTEHTAGGQWVEIGSDGQLKSSTQADGFNDDWNGADSDPGDPGGTGNTGGDDGGDDGGGDDGGGDSGGGDGGGGGGDGGGGGGGGDDDEPMEERVHPAARLDKAKLAASDIHASTTLTAHTGQAGVAAHSTPIAMDASSLRSASQLVQSMASFGVSSGALSAEHGLAGALHTAQIGLTTAHHPARMAA